MKDLSVLIFSENLENAAAARRVIEATGKARVTATANEDLAEAVDLYLPEALFVVLGNAPHRVLDMIEALPAPRLPFFLAGSQEDTSVLLRAMRMGVREFLPEDADEKALASAFEKLDRKRAEIEKPAAEAAPAPVIAIMGAKGGVGTTVVSCQVAAALQELGERVAVVDLGHPLGDVAVHFDLQPSHSLANAPSGEAIDATFLRSALQSHRSGVKVLAAPARAEESEHIGARHVSALVPALRKEFDWVILDLSHSWTEASVRALDVADQILLVTLLDVPTLNHARKRLDLLRRLGHPSTKIRLVANRYSRQSGVSEREVTEFLGRAVDAKVPNDYATVARGINQGRLIAEVAPKGPLHHAYRELAREVHGWCGREAPAGSDADEPRDLVARVRGTFMKKDRPDQPEEPSVSYDAGPRPYRVLAVTSNKGGVAKTTVATNLAVYFRALQEDLPILVVGLDDQAMIDRMFSLEPGVPRDNVVTAMREGTFEDAVRLGQYGVHYVPTSPDVSDLKQEITDIFHLREVLRRTNWKGLVILDTKSDFEILTRNAIAAADLSVVVVHDHASLVEARRVFDFTERLHRPADRARVLLSLVDRRIKFKGDEDEKIDILAHLVSEVRSKGYPMFESFVSRSPKVEALYTNPDDRAVSILHGAKESLIHLQMSHLARDVFAALEQVRAEQEASTEASAPTAPAPTPAVRPALSSSTPQRGASRGGFRPFRRVWGRSKETSGHSA
jgi:Flp pilus assembly CpaE family ATPase